jgi:hypothetical protein
MHLKSRFLKNIGVQLVLYIICTFYLALRAQGVRTRVRKFHELGLITVQLLAQISSLVVLCVWYSTRYQVVNAVSILSPLIISLLSNGYMVSFSNFHKLEDQWWRCQMIWRGTSKQRFLTKFVLRYCLPPLFLSSLGMSLHFQCDRANTHQVSGLLWLTRSSLPGLSMFSQAAIPFGIAYHVTSLCVNIFVILFIILRLLIAIRRKVLENVLPMPLVPLVAIFSISGLLYFVCSLLFMVTYVIGNPESEVRERELRKVSGSGSRNGRHCPIRKRVRVKSQN